MPQVMHGSTCPLQLAAMGQVLMGQASWVTYCMCGTVKRNMTVMKILMMIWMCDVHGKSVRGL